jgi:hypothetical protein
MATNLFERLADVPVPPAPPLKEFNTTLHERLNSNLLASHLIDFAMHGFGFAAFHFARAALGFVHLTLTGKFEVRDEGPRGDREEIV